MPSPETGADTRFPEPRPRIRYAGLRYIARSTRPISHLPFLRGARLEEGFALALLTGMRPGEWLGLSWDAIDWDAEKLEVKQAL